MNVSFTLKRFAMIALAGLLAATQTACPVTGDPVGDANGDGRFDKRDLRVVLNVLTSNQTDPSPPDGPSIADVARPCGGPLDAEDMRRLRAGLAGWNASPQSLVDSHCHGQPIGSNLLPQDPEVAVTESIDDRFVAVDRAVPGFGGFYVEDGLLRVVLKDTTAESLAATLDAIAEVFGEDVPDLPAVAVRGQYGFSELQSYRVAYRDVVLGAPGLAMLDVDEKANRFRIGLEDLSYRPEFEGELRALGIPAEAVSFEQFEKPAEFGLQDILALRQRVRPLRGGTQISLGTTGSCTLGVPARLGGTVGFLTNSHCTATTGAFDGAAQHQPNAPAPGDNSNRVGVELADSMFFTGSPCPNGLLCGNADAAFIALDAGITAYPGTIMTAGQNVRIQGETATSVVGQSLHKVGRTTGHTWGDVDCTCADVTTQGGQHVFCQDRVDDAGSNGGDSGSAVWRWASVTHRTATFHGLLWAGPSGGGDYFWFSPTNRIEAQLGNIDPTDANEPPQVAITSPQHTAVVGSGNIVPVQLVASFFDLEDGLECTLCEVRWTSDVDGYLGTSSVVNGVATLDTSLFWSGPRWIFAEAKDNNGHKSTDSILIETGNSAPSVAILRPTLTPVETVNVGSGYVLEGTSFDAELFTPLDCGSLEWTSSAFAAPSLSGCMVPTVFDTVGVHQVELTGTDPFGETDSVIHSVQVVPGPGSGPPDVSIVSPLGPGIDLHSFSMLQAYGNDPDDQSPILYEWVVRAPSHTFVSGIPPADILSNQGGVMEVRIRNTSGSDEANSQPSLWLPSSTFLSPSCSTLQFELEVRATDAQNLTTPSLPRSFSVPGPPC